MPEEFSAGTYVLTSDLYVRHILNQEGTKIVGSEEYRKDDEIDVQDEEEGKRLLAGSSIAKADSATVKEMRGEIPQGAVPRDLTPEQLRERADAMLEEAERQEQLRSEQQQEDQAKNSKEQRGEAKGNEQESGASSAETGGEGKETKTAPRARQARKNQE